MSVCQWYSLLVDRWRKITKLLTAPMFRNLHTNRRWTRWSHVTCKQLAASSSSFSSPRRMPAVWRKSLMIAWQVVFSWPDVSASIACMKFQGEFFRFFSCIFWNFWINIKWRSFVFQLFTKSDKWKVCSRSWMFYGITFCRYLLLGLSQISNFII